jgi:hypothetical protein
MSISILINIFIVILVLLIIVIIFYLVFEKSAKLWIIYFIFLAILFIFLGFFTAA